MTDARIQRPRPQRTAPHRDFASLLGAAGAVRRTAAEAGPAPPSGEAAPAAGARSFVEGGVRAAYDVIETYLRQGQRVAQDLGRSSYGPAQMGGNLADLQSRWIQLNTDIMAGWFDLLGLYSQAMMPFARTAPAPANGETGFASVPAPPSAPAAPAPPSAPAAPEAPAAPARGVSVSYEIASTRPARVSLEFLPGRDTRSVVCHDLRSLEGGAPIPVSLEASPAVEQLLVRVQVPSDQPTGLYTGVLLDSASRASVGTLSLQLS